MVGEVTQEDFVTMDPTIESVIDKTVADPEIAAKIKGSSKVVDGKTHINLGALIDSSVMLRRLEPQFVNWVYGLGLDWRKISDDMKGGLLDAYRATGNACNFMHALPESMRSRTGYAAAYQFGVAAGSAQA